MTQSTSIAVLGAGGRMGGALIRTICSDDRFSLAAALVRAGSAHEGHDAGFVAGLGEIGVAVTSELPACDAVIDFSRAGALIDRLPMIAQSGAALVSGTTGLSQAQEAELARAAETIPLLTAANMSLGVQLLYKLVVQAATALGVGVDIDIQEAHHKHKKDAPSGTALALGRAAAGARGQDFDKVARLSREGNDCLRQPGEIGFAAIRAGDIVGDHTVTFGLDGERLELTHRSASRDAFVYGALEAAQWLAGKPAGRYSMADVLSGQVAG